MKSTLREILETILIALLTFVAVRAVVQNFKVEGSSMEPNLHNGQYLLVSKAVYFNIDVGRIKEALSFIKWDGNEVIYPFHPPRRGEVIVFRFPKDPSRDFIKRVIATPGETIEIKTGRIYINGAPVDEPYLEERPTYNLEPQKVPPDNYFVLGDNRNSSSDSRFWGMVPRENLVGKAWLSYWPIERWGLAPNYSLAASGK